MKYGGFCFSASDRQPFRSSRLAVLMMMIGNMKHARVRISNTPPPVRAESTLGSHLTADEEGVDETGAKQQVREQVAPEILQRVEHPLRQKRSGHEQCYPQTRQPVKEQNTKYIRQDETAHGVYVV